MDTSPDDAPMFDLPAPQPWWKLRRCRPTDDEYIEQMRKSVTWWSRWRWWLAALALAIVCIQIGMACWIDAEFREIGAWLGALPPELIVLLAVGFGIKFGLVLEYALSTLYHCLDNQRSQRILLRLIDERTTGGRGWIDQREGSPGDRGMTPWSPDKLSS